MVFCKLAVFLAGKKRTDRNLCITFRSCYNKIFMFDHTDIRRFKVIISLAFHNPRIIKVIIWSDTCTCFIICIVNPYCISITIQIHFLESLKVLCDIIRICIVTFDTVKIMGFCVVHHCEFFIQCLIDSLCGNCDRNLFNSCNTFSCESHNKICCGIFLIFKHINCYSVAVDFQEFRIT